MDYFIYFEAVLMSFLALIVAFNVRSHGLHGRFFYVDKRQRDVTLHLAIFGTPRKKSDAHKVVTSLKSCLQHLKMDGYKSATIESHLIDDKRLASFYRLARMYGYSVKDVSRFPTPTWQRFFIPFSMALVKFKITSTNPSSMKLTLVLN
ncbi:hypothetical protein QMZ93_12230 [Pantoea stewartii subsp. indologenes]|uniref:hypothetical protein n=1 Tax=Pantoea stewartii TaxID=66269 RepID=UPI00197DEE07|nr:hypothetical protein [Pantoea stewartii]MDK2634100.1 hypothetical protein [Pantoea stewartii subsp. indologenes]